MTDLTQYYLVLGLEPTASTEEVKQAYRDLTKVWHPDRFAHDPRLQQKAQEKLKEINNAYDNLKNISSHYRKTSEQQKQYDPNDVRETAEDPLNKQEANKQETAGANSKSSLSPSYASLIIGLLVIVVASIYLVIIRKNTDDQRVSVTPPTTASITPSPTTPPATPNPKYKALSEIPEPYRTSLGDYLQSHPKLLFIKEREFDQDTLKWMRNESTLGKGFSPYHLIADFNRDGNNDFAVILKSVNKPRKDTEIDDTHQDSYLVSLVVFNGIGEKQFKVAYEEHKIDSPLVSFISIKKGKKGLYFGVAESDSGFYLAPKGQEYKVIFEELGE